MPYGSLGTPSFLTLNVLRQNFNGAIANGGAKYTRGKQIHDFQ